MAFSTKTARKEMLAARREAYMMPNSTTITSTAESHGAQEQPRRRSVSPLGASKFERPYSPPSRHTSTNTSPASPHPSRGFGTHFPRPSAASTMQSLQSETNSYSTAPTSLNNSPVREAHNHDDSDEPYEDDCGNVCVVEPDDWFAQFRSDSPDLSVSSSDECPDRATLASVGDIPLYCSDGSSKPFRTLYEPDHATHQRQLVVFVRHFYCGACQAYLKALTQAIPLSSYFSIPTPTSIIVIGCGRPDLIPFYKAVTGCPFPIYADPSRQVFKKLGMTLSMDIGSKRPEYMKDISPAAWAAGQFTTIRAGLKANVRPMKRLQKRGGSFDMVSASLEQERAGPMIDTTQAQGMMSRSTTSGSLAKETAGSAPASPARASIKSSSTQSASKASQTSSSSGEDLKLRKRDVIRGGNPFQIGGEFLFEEGEVVWCHRMRNYRNHAEVSVIRKLLELDE